METHQYFPTHNDIYSIYMTNPFKNLNENESTFIPKLLESILETYPDLKRYVAENSFDNEYLQEWLTKIIYKMKKMKKRRYSSCVKRFFQTSATSSVSFCAPVDDVKTEQIATTTSKDCEPDLKDQPSFSNESLSSTCDPVSSMTFEQNATSIFQDCKPSLKDQPSCNGSNMRTFCVANIWAGYPTFGSIYSTSKLDIIQQLKDNNKAFIPAMLEILIKKYPRLKTLLTDSSLSDDCITETFLYILRQTEKITQCFSKKEKRIYFNTVFNIEILTDISEQCIHIEKRDDTINIEQDIGNGSSVSETENGFAVSMTENGSSVSEIGNGCAVSETGNGSSVSETENGCSVSETGNGSSVSEIENGCAVSKIKNGSAILDIENGCAVSETENGCAVSKIKNGSAILDIENGYAVSETGNDFVVSDIVNGSAVFDIQNGSAVSDIDNSVKELPARCTIKNSSSVCDNEKSIDQFPFVLECKPVTPDITPEDEVGNKTNLCEYLKNLKSKYAQALDELAEKSNLEISLEKKLKSLLTKQKKYKYKIKRCRKEMTEFDSSKSICRS